MTKHLAALVVLVLLAVSFLPKGSLPAPVPAPPQTPVAAALADATSEDRKRVASFYVAMADVMERDDGVVATVGQFREVHSRSLDLAFNGTDLPGKYKGLDQAIDQQLVTAVGTADVPLTPEKRAALVQALKGVSNAAR